MSQLIRDKQGCAANKGKDLVKRYSRGNVSLQLGRYVTAEEKKDRLQKVLEMRFV